MTDTREEEKRQFLKCDECGCEAHDKVSVNRVKMLDGTAITRCSDHHTTETKQAEERLKSLPSEESEESELTTLRERLAQKEQEYESLRQSFWRTTDAIQADAATLRERVRELEGELNALAQEAKEAAEVSDRGEPLPRECAPILASLLDSLISQQCPDSVSGYAIFDAMWPEIKKFAALPHDVGQMIYDAGHAATGCDQNDIYSSEDVKAVITEGVKVLAADSPAHVQPEPSGMTKVREGLYESECRPVSFDAARRKQILERVAETPAQGQPETPRQAWDNANQLEQFLDEQIHVLNLLFDQQITPKKAIESLACYRAGNIPSLPADKPEVWTADITGSAPPQMSAREREIIQQLEAEYEADASEDAFDHFVEKLWIAAQNRR